MRRREFVVGMALAFGPASARAQTSASLPRLGWFLTSLRGPPTSDPQSPPVALLDALAKLGWIEGKTILIERLYMADAAEDAATLQARARQVVALKPDVILAGSTPAVDAIRHETRTIPIVFSGINNPLAAGFVSSLARPEGNLTGFANYEPSAFGKMIALLKEVVPGISTIALMYRFTSLSGNMRDWMFPQETMDEAAKAHFVKLVDTPVGDEREVEGIFARLAEDRNTAVLLQADPYLLQRRNSVVAFAARYRVPTIYTFSLFASAGGLMSYGSNVAEQTRQAAGYIDRILRGAKPGDLPVQFPSKYEFFINIKAASALGVVVPPTLLSIADGVIE